MADCCQICCQDHSQLRTRADRAGISPQHPDTAKQVWTICPCLRIRRLGVRVSPSAPRSKASIRLVEGPFWCRWEPRHPIKMAPVAPSARRQCRAQPFRRPARRTPGHTHTARRPGGLPGTGGWRRCRPSHAGIVPFAATASMAALAGRCTRRVRQARQAGQRLGKTKTKLACSNVDAI